MSTLLRAQDLDRDELHVFVQIAVKKSTGDLSGAAESLKNYLVSHLVDLAGWEELTELYLQVGIQCCQLISDCHEHPGILVVKVYLH